MYGNFFRNFDCTILKIIMFEVRCKSFCSALPDKTFRMRFYTTHIWLFFLTFASNNMYVTYLLNLKIIGKILNMLGKVARAAQKIQSSITSDPST